MTTQARPKERKHQGFASDDACTLCAKCPDLSLPGACITIKLAPRCGLLQSDATGHDLRFRVAFWSYRCTSHSAQERKLPHVRERVGERPLNELLQRIVRETRLNNLSVQRRQTSKESLCATIMIGVRAVLLTR